RQYDILGCFIMSFFSSRRRHTRFSRDWSSDVCSSDLENINNSLGIITVDVEYWTVGYLAHISTIGARASLQIVGCKAHLVVYNNMNSSPCHVTRQLGHLNHLVDHSLSSNCGITVDDNGNNLFKVALICVIYSSPEQPLVNRSYSFQVRRVG